MSHIDQSGWDTDHCRYRRLVALTAVAAVDRCTAQDMEEWCTPYIGRSHSDTDRRTDRSTDPGHRLASE
jgi:hypothetical protein